VAALEGLGLVLWKDKRADDALATLEKALTLAPRRELTLERAARISMERGELERSVAYWQRLIKVAPSRWQSHGFLAQTLALQQKWPAAVKACRAALRLNPFEARTRMLLIDCLIHSGQKKQAKDEFDLLLAPHPPQSDQLRRWFNDLLR
jgi:tetratricopeptide (TPR) repeat protein